MQRIATFTACLVLLLLSGNHAEIAKWRHEQALERTRERRPDLLAEDTASEAEKKRD